MAKKTNALTGALLRNLLAALAAAGVAAVVVILLADTLSDSADLPSVSPPPASAAVVPLKATMPTAAPDREFKMPGFRSPRRAGPLEVVHENNYPTKLTEGPRGWIFVTDAKCGSVFCYDQNLELRHEIKGIRRPLGIAVDQMFVMVGSDETDSIEFFNRHNGKKVFTLGAGEIKMPSDLLLDGRKLYVADSQSHVVKVYQLGRERRWLMDIGEPGSGLGQLNFPKSVAVVKSQDSDTQEVTEEIFVADQGNHRIQVFDSEGTFLRYYDAVEPEVAGVSMASLAAMASPRTLSRFRFFGEDEPFQKLQSLFVDGSGRIHALDDYTHKVMVLDSATGDVLGEYGEYGFGTGQLNLPLDILITRQGRILIANALNKRIEELGGLQ